MVCKAFACAYKHTDCLSANILQVWAQLEQTDARVTISQLELRLIDAQQLQESKQTHDNVFILSLAFMRPHHMEQTALDQSITSADSCTFTVLKTVPTWASACDFSRSWISGTEIVAKLCRANRCSVKASLQFYR